MNLQIFKITVIFITLFFSINLFAQTEPPSNLSGLELRTWLKTNWYSGQYSQLGYDGAREQMYGYVDEKPDGEVYCVYSQFHQTSAFVTYLNPINAEHTIPQSWFGQDEPMRGDIFHLYPTHEDVNNARGNLQFAEIPDNETDKWYIVNSNNTGLTVLTTAPTTNIDEYSELNTNIAFEPRESHKGDVARTAFYFFTMYPTEAGSITDLCDLNTLYQWHLQDPVDAWEIQRNNRIEEVQGNRNPYIDYPEIACRAWGTNCSSDLAITSTAITSAEINNSYTYNITYTGTDATLSCQTQPLWLNFVDNQNGTALLSGIPNSSQLGNHNVSLKLSDGVNPDVYQNFIINVTGQAVEITSLPVLSVIENNPYTYNITYTGDLVDLTCPTIPSWLNFVDNQNGTASLSGTPAFENIGLNSVQLVLTDDFTTDYQNFEIEVTENSYITIFNKDFNDNILTSGGWKSLSVSGNGQSWQISPSETGPDNTFFGYIYGFSTSPQLNEDWLVSPLFIPDNYTEKILTFWSAYNYTGNNLSVYYSNNYSGGGNPNNAIWTEITGFNFPSAQNWTWTSSENIDISQITGIKAYIAFKYTSNTTEAKAWGVDNIKLEGILNSVNISDLNQDSKINIYPNPFSDIVNIEYYLSDNSNVIIDIYDITGKKVSNLENNFQFSGKHTINWKTDDILQTGIYLLNIKTENQNIYKKIFYTNNN